MSMRIDRRRRGVIGAVLAAGAALALGLASLAPAEAATSITSSNGNVYFNAANGGSYRYGPSMIQDANGLHVYTCSPGDGRAWDQIRYSTSTDGGATWTPDQVVLTATAGSADTYSACDPGVVAFGGYYYLAYGSTTDVRGTANNVFVARSTSMTGPFDKWNGSGWGGSPQPIITYTGPSYYYGAGEPSLVVVGSTLYVFYTWAGADASGAPITQTRLSTAPTSANWPASLSYQGVAVDKTNAIGADSDDIKYVDAWGKFIAVNTARRFGPESYIQAWESPNGLDFQPADFDSSNIQRYAHNDGITGDASGHIDPSTQQYIGYAYGSTWAYWNTNIDPISLTTSSAPAAPQIYSQLAGNGSATVSFQQDSKASSYTIGYGTVAGTYTSTVTGVTSSPYTLTGLTNGTTYHVAIKGVGSGGTSAWGQDVAVTPQNFQAISGLTATASSSAGASFPASAAVDGDLGTFWSSAAHTDQAATEYLDVDTGSVHTVGRVIVTSRQPNQLASPSFDTSQSAVVQTSLDGSTWTTIDTRATMSTVRINGVPRTVLDFPHATSARYIRILATQLSRDDGASYYLQLGEVEVDALPGGAIASSALSTWPTERLTDADTSSTFSSSLHSSAAGSEWAGTDLGSNQPVSRIVLTPRVGGLAFPTAFALQSSTDGSTWTTIPGQSYTGYANPGSSAVSFGFSTVTARYFRVLATTLGGDGSGNYALQLGDFSVDTSLPATATASSTVSSSFAASNAVDQVSGTAWSSIGHSTASATEWIQLDLGSATSFEDVFIDPRGVAFPSALSLSTSSDGTTWTTLPGQSYTSFVDPASAGTAVAPTQQFHLTHPVTARYLRVTATTLRADSYGNYYFQLNDIRVAR